MIAHDEHRGFCIDHRVSHDTWSKEVTAGVEKLLWFKKRFETADSDQTVGPAVSALKAAKKERKARTKKNNSSPTDTAEAHNDFSAAVDEDSADSSQTKRESNPSKVPAKLRKAKRKAEQALRRSRVSQRLLGKASYETANEIKALYNKLNTPKETKLVQFHSVAFYSTDLTQLLPGEWINDNIISIVYEFIIQNLKDQYASSEIKLVFPSIIQLLMYMPNYDELISKKDLSAKFVFIPVNDTQEGDHWLLFVLSGLESKLYVFDSMISENTELTAKFVSIIQKMGVVKGKLQVEIVQCHQQSNFDDCGVYLIMITCFLINMLVSGDINLDISNIEFDAVKGRLDIMKLIDCLIKETNGSEER